MRAGNNWRFVYLILILSNFLIQQLKQLHRQQQQRFRQPQLKVKNKDLPLCRVIYVTQKTNTVRC